MRGARYGPRGAGSRVAIPYVSPGPVSPKRGPIGAHSATHTAALHLCCVRVQTKMRRDTGLAGRLKPRPHRPADRTPDFRSGNRGSIPRGVTIRRLREPLRAAVLPSFAKNRVGQLRRSSDNPLAVEEVSGIPAMYPRRFPHRNPAVTGASVARSTRRVRARRVKGLTGGRRGVFCATDQTTPSHALI